RRRQPLPRGVCSFLISLLDSPIRPGLLDHLPGTLDGPVGISDFMTQQRQRIAQIGAFVLLAGKQRTGRDQRQRQLLLIQTLRIQTRLALDQKPALVGLLLAVVGIQHSLVGVLDLPAAIGLAAEINDLAVVDRTALEHADVAATARWRVTGVTTDALVELLRLAAFPTQLAVQLQLLLGLAAQQFALALLFALALQFGLTLLFGLFALEGKQVVLGVLQVVIPDTGAVLTRQIDFIQPEIAVALEQALLQITHGIEAQMAQIRRNLIQARRGHLDGAADAVDVAEQ